jgi:hypothetical protein
VSFTIFVMHGQNSKQTFNNLAHAETVKSAPEATVAPATAPTTTTQAKLASDDGTKMGKKTPAAPHPQAKPKPSPHQALMAAAGIKPKDYGAASYIISHESSWRVNATEPHTGAHGLVQALPYGKTGCGWSDAECQLAWANRYAARRYGGWWGAQAFWEANKYW